MKKVIAFLICIMLCVSLCACTGKTSGSDVNSSGVSYEEQTSSEAETSSEQSSNSKDTSSKPKSETTSKNTTSKNTSSKKNTINNDRPIDNWLTPNPWPNTSSKDNSSKNTSSKTQNTSSEVDFPLFEGTGLVPGKDFGYYTYDGTFVNTVIYGDIVYSIYKSPNILVVYDAENLKLLANVPLPEVPYEIQVEESRILISFPRLRYIGIYSKTTYEQTSKINVGYEVTSFCIAGTTVYYTENSQNSYVYQTNTSGVSAHDRVSSQSFYSPKIAVNKEEGILYIGESGSAGSALYYYDIGKKKTISTYKKDGRGISNSLRTLFFVGDYVYWAGMKFDAKNANVPLAEFVSDSNPEMYFANDKYLATNLTIYDINTYQPIILFTNNVTYVTVTDSEHLVLGIDDSSLPQKVIIIPA